MHAVLVYGVLMTFAGAPLFLGSTQGDPSSSTPEWLPGEPFDKYAWIKINKMRDPFTGKEYPPTLPPNASVVANVSVVNKFAGDPSVDIISFASLHLQVWFPKDPTRPVIGEVGMTSKNGSINGNEWVGEIGGGGAGGKVWPLPECTRVYWYVRIMDLANREINSSNSVAAGPIQNYTVGGGTEKCVIAAGARFQDYFDVEQTPLAADHPSPGIPSESPPGSILSAATPVQVHLIPRRWLQMPWVILYFDQTTAAGDFNSSWLVGVRGQCRDFTVSPNVCDVSGEIENPALPIRNGTEFVFDLPGLHAGTFVQYSILIVDHAIPDYREHPDFLDDPWAFTLGRRFCEPRPQSCLSSPEFFYNVPRHPPLDHGPFYFRLTAQLMLEVHSPSGKKLGLDYVPDGCARFSNSTWGSAILRANEFGFLTSPIIALNLSPPEFEPVSFNVQAWETCGVGEPVVESRAIPNTDGPEFTVNVTFIIVFGDKTGGPHPIDVTGWPGDTYAYVYGISMVAFIVPTLALALRWFSRKRELIDEKRRESESRFKI